MLWAGLFSLVAGRIVCRQPPKTSRSRRRKFSSQSVSQPSSSFPPLPILYLRGGITRHRPKRRRRQHHTTAAGGGAGKARLKAAFRRSHGTNVGGKGEWGLTRERSSLDGRRGQSPPHSHAPVYYGPGWGSWGMGGRGRGDDWTANSHHTMSMVGGGRLTRRRAQFFATRRCGAVLSCLLLSCIKGSTTSDCCCCCLLANKQRGGKRSRRRGGGRECGLLAKAGLLSRVPLLMLERPAAEEPLHVLRLGVHVWGTCGGGSRENIFGGSSSRGGMKVLDGGFLPCCRRRRRRTLSVRRLAEGSQASGVVGVGWGGRDENSKSGTQSRQITKFREKLLAAPNTAPMPMASKCGQREDDENGQ